MNSFINQKTNMISTFTRGNEITVLNACNRDPTCTGYDYSYTYNYGYLCKQSTYPGITTAQ